MDVMLQRQFCHGRVAEIGEAGDDGFDRVSRQVGADRITVADIEDARGNPFKAEIFDEPLRSVRMHIAEMDHIVAMLREQAGNQGPYLPRSEDKDLMHKDLVFLVVYSIPP
jgi:hypothetical protein